MTATTLIDGIRTDIHRDHYDRIERVNFSTLKHMRQSPEHYRHALTMPFEDTDAKKLGRAIHIAVFEPERLRGAVAVWDGGTRRGKDWEKFRAEHEGQELLTENQWADCVSVAGAARANPVAAKYLAGGHGEVTQLWTFREEREGGYSFPCKGRLDFLSKSAIVDLKTTRNASPDGFGREVWNYRYHAQAAWYQDGHAIATGRRLPYFIVAVENYAPYVTQVYRVPDPVLQLGREEYSAWLLRLAHCRATSEWPAYHDAELELSLPRWVSGDVTDDEDVGALGLEGSGLGSVDLITPAN